MEWEDILQCPELIERYKALIQRNCQMQDDCWIWQKTKDKDGYGEACISKHRRKRQQAYRVAYIVYKGIIPKGVQVRHMCNNKACCNPEHLILGTASDNMRDRQSNNKGISDENFKMNRDAVLDIYHLRYDLHYTNEMIQRDYNLSESAVRSIYLGKSWVDTFKEYWNLATDEEVLQKRKELQGGDY